MYGYASRYVTKGAAVLTMTIGKKVAFPLLYNNHVPISASVCPSDNNRLFAAGSCIPIYTLPTDFMTKVIQTKITALVKAMCNSGS